MQIAIYQIGNRGMLKVEGAKIRIKSYKISNDIKGKVLTVEIPLTEQDTFFEEKAELSKQKEIEKDNHEKILDLDVEINITQKDGRRNTRFIDDSFVIINVLEQGLANVILETTAPDIPLTKLEEIANETRGSLLRIMCRMKGYQ